MHRWLRGCRPGFLLLEALLGITVFGMFLTAVTFILLHGQEESIRGGDRMRAVLHSEKALEAARSIRDSDFNLLTPGAHGVSVNPAGQWVFSGSKTVYDNRYTTVVTVNSLASDWVSVSAQTTWNQWYGRSGSLVITTELTDWRLLQNAGDWSGNSLEGSYVDSGTPLFNDIAVSGNYAFVTSDISAGGAGLYVFDISTLTAPVRVASSFSLGAAGYEVAVSNATLYVLTGDTGQEIQAYDVTSPSTFSSADLKTSYDIAGNGRARSLIIEDDRLYVGVTESAMGGEDEFYAFNISNSGAIALLGSLDQATTNLSVHLSGTAAYLAGSLDTVEIGVVSIENPAVPVEDSAVGYNVTDTMDGSAVRVAGTSAVLGRLNGSSIEELVLFDVKKRPVPLPPPGPWYRDMGGSVNGLAVDILGCYAWVATDNASKELQIVSLRNTSLPEASSYNTTTGDGRGVFYDATRDRAYLLTNKAFLIIQPSSSNGTCT